ncbi:MAG TPA: signal peptidase II [Anaerolineales bacterium]|nr:signal peptidase II [Anaerolineales bacterium]
MTKIHRLALAILVLFFCTGFDQVTKDVAQERLADAPPISLLNDTIRIQYMENTGVTLGLGSNLPREVRFVLFVLLNGLITVMTLLYALKLHDLRFMQIVGLLLVASGGLGNLIDRLFNNGAAIDFMNIGIGSLRTGVFNVADILVVAGAALFMLVSVRDQRKATVA